MFKFFIYSLLNFNCFSMNFDFSLLKIENLLNLDFFEKNNNEPKEIKTFDEHKDLLNLFFINIFESILFLLLVIIFANIKIVLFSSLMFIILILYNSIFYIKQYILHIIAIATVFLILFFLGAESIFIISLSMMIVRLFTLFLVFNKLFNIWKESDSY